MTGVGRPSKTDRLKEYARCVQSPVYYGEKYCKVFDLTSDDIIPFKLFPKQKEFINNCLNHRFNIVRKPRQTGVSTTTALVVSTNIMFQENRKVLIIANKQDIAHEFLKKVKEFIKYTPDWMGINIIRETQGLVELNNGSIAKAVATSIDALRSFSPTLLIMDEAAYIDHSSDVWTAAQPALATGGGAILLSCVTDDTFVFTDKGIKQIKNFINPIKIGGYKINNYNILGKNKLRSGNLFNNNGYVDTIKIETIHAELEGSRNHKLWSYNNGKYDWCELKNLRIGDYVAIQYGGNIWGNNNDVGDFVPENSNKIKNKFNPKKITNNIAYFLGMFIAEGSTYKAKNKNGKHWGTSITLTCGDDISHVFKNIGLNYSCTDGLHYTCGSKHLGQFLEYLGFNLSLKANKKYIPSRLLELSREKMIYLLRGLFDGDGCSQKDKGFVSYVSSSKKLINQIRIILNNFGILTDYFEVLTPATKRVKVKSMGYRISCNARFSKVFYKEIGFNFQRKQKNKIILNKYNLERNDPYDVIPNGVSIIKTLYKKTNQSVYTLQDKGINISHVATIKKPNSWNISRGLLTKFVDSIKHELNGELKKLDGVLSPNIKWIKIKKIIQSKNYTYDFSLPQIDDKWCHSIIYNGIIGHQTPNGMDELYYSIYDAAKNKRNNFHITEFKWYEDPRYNKELKWIKGDIIIDDWIKRIVVEDDFITFKKLEENGFTATSPWFEDMCRQLNGDQRKISQELLGSFLGSGDNVIDEKYIEIQEKENVRTPIRCEEFDNNMWIWEDPIVDHQYIQTIDVSRGDSADFSTIVIIDINTNHEVAEYQGKVPPDYLGEMAYKYAIKYQAYTIVDITGGMGVATVLKLLDLNLDKKLLHYDLPKNKILMERLKRQRRGDKIPGFNIGANRVLVVQELERQIRQTEFIVRSKRATSEMKTFIYKNGRPDHMTGYHDDILLAMAQGLFVVQTSFKNLKKHNSQTKAMLDSMLSNSNDYKDNITPQTNHLGESNQKWAAQQYSWLLTPFAK